LRLRPIFNVPHAQDAWQSMVLVAKTKVELGMADLFGNVWAIDKNQPVFDVRHMGEVRAIHWPFTAFLPWMLAILRSGAGARSYGI